MQIMAKSKSKKPTRVVKAAAKRVASGAKKPSKSAAAKKAARPAAAGSSSSSRGAAAPGSTDIRQAYKSFLLADYLGEKKPQSRTGKKRRESRLSLKKPKLKT